MDLLLFEWSFAGGARSRGLLPEGFGMLRSITESFQKQDIQITVLASKKYEKYVSFLNADDTIMTAEDPGKIYLEKASNFDSTFIIAPESNGILLNLAKSSPPDTRLLSCSTRTIELFSDKENANKIVVNTCKNLRVPNYLPTNVELRKVKKAAAEVGYPCVVKPVNGAGSEGSSVIRSSSEVPKACAKIKAAGFSRSLVQEYVRGRSLSGTFHATRTGIIPLGISTQLISPSGSLEYMGGSCPFPLDRNPVWDDLRKIAVENEIEGTMGMDFILQRDKLNFVEMNPRITTSCVGISKIIKPGLGSIIADGKINPQLDGYSQWNILPLRRSIRFDEKVFPRLLEIPQIISPPFPVGPFYMKDSSKALICVWGPDSMELPTAIKDIKRRLEGMHILC